MTPRPLPHAFYARPTLDVLRDLMGMLLVHVVRGRRTAGRIVEAEAYIGEEDPACHAACGPTRRNAPLYGPPGFAYVYLNYGLHALVNAVTEAEGRPAAILIRALEPVENLPAMRRRRARPVPDHELCRGPGNLTVALGITLAHNRCDLHASVLRIEDDGRRPGSVEWSPRIGIRVGTEAPWRCVVTGSPSVSGARRSGSRASGADRSGRAPRPARSRRPSP